MKNYLILLVALSFSNTVLSQVSLTGIDYSQDFNTLSNTPGSVFNSLAITGWSLNETGGGARDNENYAVDNGGSTTGDTYSYGPIGSTNRSLGSLRSGTLISTFGAFFTNNTGGLITSMTISYTGEEWRFGTSGRTDQLDFQYSLDATSLTSGTWIDVNALDFITPNTITVGAKDGTLAGNRTVISNMITGLIIPEGSTFYIRWNDTDVTGPDDGLAIDNFVLATSAAAPLSASINTHVNAGCNGGASGSATVTVSGGTSPYTYSWSPSGGTGVTATGLIASVYTVTVTDAVSSSTTASVTITEPPAITFTPASQTNIACFGGSTGAAAVNVATGGTGSFTYNWTPGNPTGDGTTSITGLTAGVWAVAATDVNGCTATLSFTITEPSAINTSSGSQTNVSCNSGTNGSASVSPSGGTPGYSYSWSPSGGTAATATGLAAGSYTVTVTDANGCTATGDYTITEPSAINTSSGSQTNVSCNGGTNGSASVSPSGGTPGYTYSWSPSGGTVATATGLAAGSYTVTVTDANGCTATRDYTVTEPSVINTSSGSQTNVSCNGGSNGSASVSPSGGTPGYTYSWSPSGGTVATATGLAAGSYTVTVTDANGCTATRDYTITEPSAINISSGPQTNVSCNGGSNGSASVSPSGGTPVYTYSWSPSGGTAATASGLVAGTYMVTITDANGFTATDSYTITEPPIITATTSQTNVGCNGSSTGSASVIASGGTGGYTYSWSPSGGTGATASDLAAGLYTCIITDANTCSITKDFTINESPALTATTSQVNETCTGGAMGSATVVVSGGTGTKTYSWSPSGGTGATADNLAAGDYTCTITDANLCSITKIFSITEPAFTPGSNNYLLPTSNQTVTHTAGTANFVNSTCELVSTIVPSGASPVSGMVTSKVWIEGTVPSANGNPFVQRHYEITPATNAPDATGTVTLYFTQTEFDNFNAHAGSTLDLPVNAADDAGKTNLRIGKYSGISGSGTGLPSSYNSSTMVIDPVDSNIVWNATSGTWEITFAVDGFSGFIVQTNTFVLPVNWISFTVRKINQSVLLNWSTATEHNTRDFSIQHSTDGIYWKTAGVVAAAGNSSSLHNYTYVDNNTVKGYNYYRVAQTDLDGKITYSEMRLIKMQGDHTPFTIVGNPVSNGVLQVQVHQATALSLYEINGKLLWVKQFTAGLQSIDVSRYATGIYFLKTNGKTQKIFIE